MDGAHVVISSKKQRNVGPAAAALQGEGLSMKGTMSHGTKGKGPDSWWPLWGRVIILKL